MKDPISGLIGSIVGPVADVIDSLHTSGEEKAAALQELTRIEQKAKAEANRHVEEIVKSQRDVILAEATGHSWMQRNWRPVLMFVIMFILANNFIIAPYINAIFGGDTGLFLDLPAELWTLMTLGVSGYIGLRSFEKAAPTIKTAFTGRRAGGRSDEPPVPSGRIPPEDLDALDGDSEPQNRGRIGW